MKQIVLILLFINCTFMLQAQPELITNLPDFPSQLISCRGELYFSIDNELWKSDGTDAGTEWVKTFTGEISLIEAGGLLFIDVENLGLYISDGTDA